MQPTADVLANRATAVITQFVRFGAVLAGFVALLGLIVAGLAFLIGRSALDGDAESVWTVIGALLLIGAVVPPVVAAVRLLSVGRSSTRLVADFRSLLDGGGDATQVVIETTEVVGERGPALVTTVMPTIGRLRTEAVRVGTAQRLNDILAALTSLPLLLLLAIVAMLLSAGAGFVLLLVWIF